MSNEMFDNIEGVVESEDVDLHKRRRRADLMSLLKELQDRKQESHLLLLRMCIFENIDSPLGTRMICILAEKRKEVCEAVDEVNYWLSLC